MATRHKVDIKKTAKMNTTWLKNAMKSVGLTATETFKDLAPNIYEAGNVGVQSVQSIKSAAMTSKNTNVMNRLKNNKYFGYAQKGFQNALDDIKTGKLNNKEREDEALLGGFEDMLNFSDFDDEDSGNTINYIDGGMDNEAVFNIQDSIQKSTEANIKAQKASTDAMIATASVNMIATQELGKEVISHLRNINNGISALVEFQRENTLKFYETATAALEKIGSATGSNEEEERYRGDADAKRVVRGNGSIDIARYKEYVKQNIKTTLKNTEAGGALDLLLSSDDMIEMMISNPIGGASNLLLKAAIPNLVTNTIKGMDEAFKDFMPTMIAKLTDWKNNQEIGLAGSIKKLIGQAFGINIDNSSKVDLSGKITKDAAVFDGFTRNSIVNVIPKHLSEMSSYLKDIADHFKIDTKKSQENREVFNPDTGKFTTMKDFQKEIVQGFTDALTESMGRTKFGKALAAGGSELYGQDEKNYNKIMEQLAHGIYRSQKDLTAEDMNIDDPDSVISQLLSMIGKGMGKRGGKAVRTARETVRQMNKNKIGLDVSSANYAIKAAGSNYRNELEDDDYRVLTSGISDLSLSSDELLDYSGYKNAREAKKARKKQEDHFRERHDRKHNKKGSVKKIVSAGLENSNLIQSPRDKEKMDNANGATQLIASTGEHLTNSMKMIMAGDSKGAVKEFANIFGESMKTFWGSLKENFINPMKETIFGEKDENGYLQNGLFGGVQNKAKDIWNEVGAKITGKAWKDSTGKTHEIDKNDSVFGKVQNTVKSITESVKYRLFGSKEDDDENGDGNGKKTKGIVKGIFGTLKEGINGWSEYFFGKDPEKAKKDLKEKAMDAIPDIGAGAIAGAGISLMSGGLLGVAIGNPLVGAGIGMVGGMLKKSDKFQEYLFGKEIEDEDGNLTRAGGLISKKTQDMFKNGNLKKSVIGGAALGMAKNAILGSSGGVLGMLVGGPIAGSIMGAGLGLLKESQMFKDFWYGNEEEGKEGVKKKISNAVKGMFGKGNEESKGDNKKKLGMAAIGGGAGGLLGLAMGGPLGAIAGLGFGITAAGDKFKKWMFGEKDENGKKTKVGVVGKLENWMHTEIVAPAKSKMLNIMDDAKSFFTHKIFNKIAILMDPITEKLKEIGDKFRKKSGEAFRFVKKLTIDPIVKVANAVVFKPIRAVVSKATDLAWKSIKAAVSLPVKLIQFAVVNPFKNLAKTIKDKVVSIAEVITRPFRMVGNFVKGLMTKVKNRVKSGVKAVGAYAKRKISEKKDNLVDKVSGAGIFGRKLVNGLRKTGSVSQRLHDEDIAYMEEKRENRKKKNLRRDQDKMRSQMAKILGHDVKYLTKDSYEEAVSKDKSFGKRWGKLDEVQKKGLLEKSPEEIAKEKEEEIAKKNADAVKASPSDLMNANSSDMTIEARTLQESTRQTSLLSRLVSFITGEKSNVGADYSGDSDGATKDDKKNKGKENEGENEGEGENNENDEEKSLFERYSEELNKEGLSGFLTNRKNEVKDYFTGKINSIKDRFSGVTNFFKNKFGADESNREETENYINKLSGINAEKLAEEGRARAKGGDADKDKAYLVGDGGSDPSAAEIFTPKTNGKVLSQNGKGIKVFVEGFSKSAEKQIETGSEDATKTPVPNATGGSSGAEFNIASALAKANSEADYDENGNLIEEKVDSSAFAGKSGKDAAKAVVDTDNATDLANAKNKGSYEAQQKKKQEKKEDDKHFQLLDKLKDIGKNTKETGKGIFNFSDAWSTIFSKKGLITGGLLLLFAKFPNLFSGIIDLAKNIGPTILGLLKNIGPLLLKIIGGIGKFAGNVIGEQIDNADFKLNGNDGIGTNKDGMNTEEALNDEVDQLKNGNILQLQDDGSAGHGTTASVRVLGKRALNIANRNNVGLTIKGHGRANQMEKKFYRGVEKTYKSAKTLKNGGSWEDVKKIIKEKPNGGKKKKKFRDLFKKNKAPKEKKPFFQYTPGNQKNVATDVAEDVAENAADATVDATKKGATEVAEGAADAAVDTATKGASEAAESAAEKTAKNAVVDAGVDAAEDAATAASKNAGKSAAESAVKDAADAASKESGGILKKAGEMVGKFFSSLKDKLLEKLGKKGGGKITQALQKFTANKFVDGLKKVGKGALAKLASFMAGKITIGSVTLGVSELVFAAGGAIDGAVAAAKLFEINRKDLDATMILIGAAWGLVAGTTPGGIFDFVCQILSVVPGFTGIQKSIAYAIYAALKGEDALKDLNEKNDAFKKEYEEENEANIKKQYETQKKAGLIGEDVTYDEFKAGVKAGTYKINQQSFEDYNTEKNGGIVDHVVGGVGKAAHAIGHGVKTFFTGTESYTDDKGNKYTKNSEGNWDVQDADGNDLGTVATDAVDTSNMEDTSSGGVVGGFKKIGGFLLNGAKKIGGAVVGGAKAVGGAVVNGGKAVVGGALKLGNAAGNAIKNGAKNVKHWFKNYYMGTEKYTDDEGNIYTKNADGNWDVQDADGNDLGTIPFDQLDTSKLKDISSDGFFGKAKKIGGAIADGAKKIGGAVGNAIKNSPGGKVAQNVWENTKDAAKRWAGGAKKAAGGVKKFFKGDFKGAITDVAGGMWDSTIGNMMEGSKKQLNKIKDTFTGWFKENKKKVFMSPDGDYYCMESNKTYSHYSATDSLLEKGIKPDSEQGKEIANMIKNGTLVAGERKTQGKLKGIVENVSKNVKEGWTGFKKGLGDWWANMKDPNKSLGQKLKDTGTTVLNGVKSVGGKLVDGAKQLGSAVANFFGFGGSGENDNKKDTNGQNPSTYNGFKYYSQKDSRWGRQPYAQKGSNDTMSNAGCGPTAMAMVTSQLTGKEKNPIDIARDAKTSGFVDKTGTNANFISTEANKYKLGANQTLRPNPRYIMSELASGHPMILNGVSEKGGIYTTKGHYVVAVGTTKDGKVVINDPRGKQYSRSYPVEALAQQTRVGWSFTKGKKKLANNLQGISGRGENTFTADDVINIAKGEVGYSEKASNKDLDDKKANPGSGNFTKYAKEVGHTNGLAWCATFVTWCFTKAANGDKNKAKEVLCGANTAGCANNQAAFKRAGRLDMKPQPGDVVYFMNGSSHTGLVVAVDGDKITTIEGNTSPGKFNRDGGCVAEKTYNIKSEKRISGFGHPKFDGESSYKGDDSATTDENTDGNTNSSNENNSSDSSATTDSDNFITKASNLFSQYASKVMTGMTTGKWDTNYTTDTSDDSTSTDATEDTSTDNNSNEESSGTTYPTVDVSDAKISDLPDKLQGADLKSIPHVSAKQIKKAIKTNFSSKGNSVFKKGQEDNDANGLYQAQEEQGLSAIIPMSIGALESGWGTSKIARNKGNLWGWGAVNSNPYGGAKSFEPNDMGKSFGIYSSELLNKYYKEYGAKSINSIGTGNNPSKKGYAYSDDGKPSTTWAPQVTSCGKRIINSMGGKGGDDEDGDFISFARDLQEISGAGNGDANYLNSLTRNFNLQVEKRASGFNPNLKNATDVSTLEYLLQKTVEYLAKINGTSESQLTELKNITNGKSNILANTVNNYNDNRTNTTTSSGSNPESRNSMLARQLAKG